MSNYRMSKYMVSPAPIWTSPRVDSGTPSCAVTRRGISPLLCTVSADTVSGSVDINVEMLPPEVLAHIFSYLRAEDLVTVQDVCRLWNEVSQGSNIWSRISYNPSREVQYGDVENILRRAPNLQSCLPEDGIDDRLSKLLIKYCPLLRKLSLNAGVLCERKIAEILCHYHGIEDLKLVQVDFRFNIPPGGVFDTIVNCCPSLKRLDLLCFKGVSISFDNILRSLGNATHLTDLKLPVSGTNYQMIRSRISSCKNLESLTLKFDILFWDICLDFLESLPKLNGLSLLGVEPLVLLSLFEQNVPKLQHLEICHYTYLTLEENRNLEFFFTKCSSLKTLVFSYCHGLCGDSFRYIKELQQLECLILDHCRHLSDNDMGYIRGCRNLRALEVHYCSLLTNRTPLIVKNSKKLSRFVFKKCIKRRQYRPLS